MKPFFKITNITFLGIALSYFCIMSLAFLISGGFKETIALYYWAITIALSFLFTYSLKQIKRNEYN